MKKIFKWIFIIIVIFLVIGALGSSGNNNTNNEDSTNSICGKDGILNASVKFKEGQFIITNNDIFEKI